MVLVENIFLNEDGSRQDHAVPSFANSFPPVTSTNLSRNTTNREADLKKIFVRPTFKYCISFYRCHWIACAKFLMS